MKLVIAGAVALYVAGGMWASAGAQYGGQGQPGATPVSPLPQPIGTVAYSRSCRVVEEHEGGSLLAFCWEDGAYYLFDADGNDPPAGVVYEGPRWARGWYVCMGGAERVTVPSGLGGSVSFLTCVDPDYTREVSA